MAVLLAFVWSGMWIFHLLSEMVSVYIHWCAIRMLIGREDFGNQYHLHFINV